MRQWCWCSPTQHTTSGLPIPMVPRLHQNNAYIKRKLRVWRCQRCIALVRAPHLPVRVSKLSHFMGGRIGLRMEICEISGLTIPMVLRLHQTMLISKGSYRYGKLENVLSLSVQKQYLPVRARKLPRFIGGSIGSGIEICENSGLPIPMVTRLHQSNGHIKMKLRVWRAQKCIDFVGAETVLTSAGPQTTLFHGGQYRVGN